MDIWAIILITGGIALLIIWLRGERARKRELPGYREVGQMRETKEIAKRGEMLPEKAPQALDERWLQREMVGLISYINTPSAVEKFFLGLRQTYVNKKDREVIDSYREKMSSIISLIRTQTEGIEAEIARRLAMDRYEQLDEEIDLRRIRAQIEILKLRQEVKSWEEKIDGGREKLTPQEKLEQEYKIKNLELKKTFDFERKKLEGIAVLRKRWEKEGYRPKDIEAMVEEVRRSLYEEGGAK